MTRQADIGYALNGDLFLFFFIVIIAIYTIIFKTVSAAVIITAVKFFVV